MIAPRCYLFVPGDRPDMLAKAPARGADALIVDLEDAVADAKRESAFDTTAAWLRRHGRRSGEIWVRIPGSNPGEEIERIGSAGLTGIMLPKPRSREQVAAVVESGAWRRAGVRPRVIVLVETAAAMQDIDVIARIPGVTRLMIGEVDLCAELGIATGEELALAPLRSRLVVASASAALPGPIAPVRTDFGDVGALEQFGRRLRDQGFRAGAAIHPRQIEPLVKAFTPSAPELAAARRLIDLHEAALSGGRGAALDHRGEMIDEAVVRAARRVLSEFGMTAGGDGI